MPITTALAFDFGSVKTGVAVGQDMTRSAEALTTVQGTDSPTFWKTLAELIEQWNPGVLVVGLPLHLDGRESPMSGKARRFAQQLHDRFSLAVYLVDERLSSEAANTALNATLEPGRSARKRNHARDKLAAELILNSYYENRNPDSMESIQ